MRRYYFHYRDCNDELTEDRVGSAHIDLDAVEREAEDVAREILVDELARGLPLFAPRCLEIENEDGDVVLYLPFWAAARLADSDSSICALVSLG